MRALWVAAVLGQDLLSQASGAAYPIPPGYAVARRIGAPRALHDARPDPPRPPARALVRTSEDGDSAASEESAEESEGEGEEQTYPVHMDRELHATAVLVIPANATANATNATNATANATANASSPANATAPPRQVEHNGFMGNPYTGVFVAPMVDRPMTDRPSRRLDVSRVKSISCLERMIKEPDHECDPDQLLPGSADPGLVTSDPANVHMTPSTRAISEAAADAAKAAKLALAAADAAKAAAEAVAAAQKSHATDVQTAVETASLAAADAAAAAVQGSPEAVEAAAHEAAKAAAVAAAQEAAPDMPAVQAAAEKAAIEAGVAAVELSLNGTSAAAENATDAEGAAEAPAEDAAEAADAPEAADAADAADAVDAADADAVDTEVATVQAGSAGRKSSLLHRGPARPAVLHHKVRRSQNLR